MPTYDVPAFLAATKSQRAVSLLIAKDEVEIQSFQHMLAGEKFLQMHTVADLLKHVASPSKMYFVIRNAMPIEIYEFIQQYPMGHISILDRKRQKIQVARTPHTDISLVFLITKKTLNHLQAAGYSFYDKTGLTYQK